MHIITKDNSSLKLPTLWSINLSTNNTSHVFLFVQTDKKNIELFITSRYKYWGTPSARGTPITEI